MLSPPGSDAQVASGTLPYHRCQQTGMPAPTSSTCSSSTRRSTNASRPRSRRSMTTAKMCTMCRAWRVHTRAMCLTYSRCEHHSFVRSCHVQHLVCQLDALPCRASSLDAALPAWLCPAHPGRGSFMNRAVGDLGHQCTPWSADQAVPPMQPAQAAHGLLSQQGQCRRLRWPLQGL